VPLRYEQLPAALNRGLSPLYLIAGPEPLLVQECRDQVRQAAGAAGFLERDIVQVNQHFDWDSLRSMAGAPSLFASRRIVDLRLPTGKPGQDGGKALSEWAAKPDPDTLLIVSCDEWDAGSRKAKWAGEMERAGTRVDIWPVKPNELPAWVGRRMQAAGLQADARAIAVLVERVEGNLLAAQQEIDKLLLQKGPGPVSADEVLAMVSDSSRFDAFLLLDRMLEGNTLEGLRVATGLRRTGIAIQAVVGALHYGLKNFDVFNLAVRGGKNEQSVFTAMRIWQSQQKLMSTAARRLPPSRVAWAFSQLALIDRQGKGQAAGDPWHSLDRLVCRLCD
jgi:DNA polymerase-3 subunit delta